MFSNKAKLKLNQIISNAGTVISNHNKITMKTTDYFIKLYNGSVSTFFYCKNPSRPLLRR